MISLVALVMVVARALGITGPSYQASAHLFAGAMFFGWWVLFLADVEEEDRGFYFDTGLMVTAAEVFFFVARHSCGA